MEPNTPQLSMIVKCSDALSMPLPAISPAGTSGLVQAAWYDEDKQHHTYITVDRLGIVTAVWLTTFDEGGFIVTESNPSGIVDIFQAHSLPLGYNVVGEVSVEDGLQLDLDDNDAMALIYALRNAHGFTGEMYGVSDAVAALEGVLGSEEELLKLASEGVLMDALRATDSWIALDEMLETDQTFETLIRSAAIEAAPALGRHPHHTEQLPAPVAASEVAQ